MPVNFQKLAGGGVEITTSGTNGFSVGALQGVHLKVDKDSSGASIIRISSVSWSQSFKYSEIGTINGVAKPGTAEATRKLLSSDVFNFGGGSGIGATRYTLAQWNALTPTQQASIPLAVVD